MLRTKNPGFVPPQLYLSLDKLAGEYGNQTLLCHQTGLSAAWDFEENLKSAIAAIIKHGFDPSSLRRCQPQCHGTTSPFKNRAEYQYAWEYAQNIADLTPQTGALRNLAGWGKGN